MKKSSFIGSRRNSGKLSERLARKTLDKHPFMKLMSDFPRSELWRLWTDGNQQKKGKHDFKEQYLNGMQSAWDYLVSNINTPMTAGQVEEFQKLAAKDYDVPKGYRDNLAGQFLLTLKISGEYEVDAEISTSGLPEFVEKMEEAENTPTMKRKRNAEPFPKWHVEVEKFNDGKKIGSTQELAPSQLGKDNVEAILSEALPNASMTLKYRTEYPKIDMQNIKGEQTYVPLSTNRDLREHIVELVDQRLEKCHQALADADGNIGKIQEIVSLVRDLMQDHNFPDMNRRAIVFLMANAYFGRNYNPEDENSLTPMICETPAHFAGFSLEEITQEAMNGMAHFKDYLIAPARKYLEEMSVKEFMESKGDCKHDLSRMLSQSPEIALAQINCLFEKIQSGQIKFPAEFKSRRLSISKTMTDCIKARTELCSSLKELYAEKTHEVCNNKDQDFAVSRKAYTDNVESHSIISNESVSFGDGRETLKSYCEKELDKTFGNESKLEFEGGPVNKM